MRQFKAREIHEARACAAIGGIALHCHRFLGARPPACFRRDVEAGKDIGHLFDQDRRRLEWWARRLGVHKIVVEKPGTPDQHIDLCGGPMRLALTECENTALFPELQEKRR